MSSADIGIFGGSGLYSLLEDLQEIKVETPYGAPSDKLAIGTFEGKKVAFLPRHSKTHSIPPHAINYRANIFAFKSLGVKHIISPNAAGSLQTHIKPGHFVVCDQFIDRTSGRKDTFYDGPITTHILGAEPYCPHLRKLAVDQINKEGVVGHDKGTVVVIQGPRFSSKAESEWFTKMGWEVVNMTQYPEVVLAREQEMCFANISLITDYDCGLMGDVPPTTVEEMLGTFKQNIEKVQDVIKGMIRTIDVKKSCSCHSALKQGRFND